MARHTTKTLTEVELEFMQILWTEDEASPEDIQKNLLQKGRTLTGGTIRKMLSILMKKGYVKSEWDMRNERPRKVYQLTTDGKNLLNFTEDSLVFICKKIGTPGITKRLSSEENVSQPIMHPLLRRIEKVKPTI